MNVYCSIVHCKWAASPFLLLTPLLPLLISPSQPSSLLSLFPQTPPPHSSLPAPSSQSAVPHPPNPPFPLPAPACPPHVPLFPPAPPPPPAPFICPGFPTHFPSLPPQAQVSHLFYIHPYMFHPPIRDHSVHEGLEYVSLWNSSFLLSREMEQLVQRLMKRGNNKMTRDSKRGLVGGGWDSSSSSSNSNNGQQQTAGQRSKL